jgi:hypothetical protein
LAARSASAAPVAMRHASAAATSVRSLEAISKIPVRPAARDFSIRWDNGDAVVLTVLQGAVVPSGRKITDSPEGYGPFSRLRRWDTAPVGAATVTRVPPCTRKNGPITGRTGIFEMASSHRSLPVGLSDQYGPYG